jgi:hypothetical protein
MKRNLIAFLVALIVTLLVGNYLLTSRVSETIPCATDIELIARCKLIYFDTRLQPVITLVLACPRMDMTIVALAYSATLV